MYRAFMDHATISRAEFCSLRSGDLVVWRGKYFRTVTKGPADGPQHHPTVEFPIRRRSWRKRIDTTYCYNDLKCVIAPANRRTRGLMLPSEWKTLEVAGFDVRKELKRELDDKTACAQRMGKPLCKAYPRLEKLITSAKRR